MNMGRNDLCRCGSGKKFKRCCRNQAPVLEPVKPRLILAHGHLTRRWKAALQSGPPPAYLKPVS
jgi:hypothetical protein